MDSDGAQSAAEGLRRPWRLWLVRHGTTSLNEQGRYCGWSDPPLSTSGGVQARWLAHRLRDARLIKMYCSDSLRAKNTASIILENASERIEVQYTAQWRELNFGAWEGLTYEEIRTRFPAEKGFFQKPLEIAPPGGESFPQLLQRIDEGWRVILADVMSQEQERNVENGSIQYTLVSHGGPLRALLCKLLNWPMEYQWQLRLEPGSLSAVDLFWDGTSLFATLVLLNEQNSDVASRVFGVVSEKKGNK
ncbi:histidine phosphatase family protein [Ktedonospora formicarum]|uniref:Alpha-ribazole phosphatase n=1 Tax=Ktedonospora formicarum TaxID=2778364 RepID=A0A8J3MRS2_9CHLR|nr:histidine phosphatase family protein [Ktedonospora formicarum]GHO46407.1 alpha-ribazole phosphatase [Ktedonospora formicarum]